MGVGRLFKALILIWCTSFWASSAIATEEFSALARIDLSQTRISDIGDARVEIRLGLSIGVPYRLFTLQAPPRLVMDFREVDWSGVRADEVLQSERISTLRFGAYVPGWSRLVAELTMPMAIETVDLQLDAQTRAGVLSVDLVGTTADAFAAAAGAPFDPNWDLPAVVQPDVRQKARDDDVFVVALDPGHGGMDPGAESGRVNEKELMLTFARELREVLLRSGGFEVVLTRDEDVFVSLDRRIALAHQAGADVFLSLHADSLAEGLAHGATVHILSEEASDIASDRLAERHDRAELLSGADLSTADDEVTGILLDLARQETRPRTKALAQALVNGMAQIGGPMNSRPLRAAAFSVLKAADMPSVLIEIGFISSPRDLKNLQNAEWRGGMALGIRNALIEWREQDLARRAMVRQ